MNRKDAIKSIFALSISAVLPLNLVFEKSNIKKEQQENKIHYIGFGNAGAHIVQSLAVKYPHHKFIIANNQKINNLYKEINFVRTENFRKLHPGIFEKIYDFSIQDGNSKIFIPNKLKEILNKNNSFVLIAGLGGITGSFLIKKTAEYLNAQNKDFRIVASLPFKFEGRKRNYIANSILNELKQYSTCNYFELNKLLADKDPTIKQAFLMADNAMIKYC